MADRFPTARIAEFVAGTSLAQMPPAVREAAALHVLDTLGCGVAALATDAAASVRAATAATAPDGPCTALGLARGVALESAAFANGALCHALDFDDTHGRSICHVSTVVVPAALAVAEAQGSSGTALLEAIVAGGEVVARIGAAAAPAYMRTGFHHTGVCGAFGATAAAARLLGLDARAVQHALGLCGSLASGSFAFLDDGSATAKAVNAGAAARAGVLAATLAAHGADGPQEILAGRFGLFATYFRIAEPALDVELDALGSAWETPRIAFKPYPACHFVHSSLDAVREACDRLGVRAPGEVEAIAVEVPAPALPLVLEPRAAKLRPRTPYEGKFSLQYSVAAMVAHRRVGIASYAPSAIADPDTLALAARVAHRAADFDSFPAAFPARVAVTAAGGSETVEVAFQRGSAERPLERADVLGKFGDNASLALDSAGVARLRDRTLELGQLAAVATLTAALAAARPPEERM